MKENSSEPEDLTLKIIRNVAEKNFENRKQTLVIFTIFS